MAATDWIGGSGDWSDASNWSAGVPNDDTVQATLGGTDAYTATIGANESFTVGSLDINDANAVLSLNSDLTAANSIDLEAGTLAVGARGVLNGSSANATFVNHGTILAETAGGVFATDGIVFTNAGTFDIGNSNTAYIEGPFTNTGTVNVASGSRLVLQGGGTTAELGDIANSGQIWLFNTLDNSNAVLKVGSGTSLGTVQLNGTIKGGTIVDSGGGLITMGGILDGVEYEGTLAVASSVLVKDGLSFTGVTGTGAGTLVVDHDAGVYFEGTQTLDNVTVTLGSPSATGALISDSNYGSTATLTLGSGDTVLVKSAGSLIRGDGSIVNQGRIIAETQATQYIPDGAASMAASAITNAGAIIVANGQGDVFQVVAPLTNSGAAEVISGILDLRGAVTGTGSIQIDRSGVLLVEQAMGAGQRVVFYQTGGALELASSSTFQAPIAGFTSGHFLDLRDVSFGSGTSVHFTATSGGGTLTVSDGTHTANLRLVGNFSGGTFMDKADDIGGTIVFFTDTATAAAQSRLHQFNSAVATHSADRAGSISVHSLTPGETAVSLLAAAHH